MNSSRRTLFVSDLHLEENTPRILEDFLKVLTGCDKNVDALYILGDLFEVWVGDDEQSAFHQNVIDALHRASSNGLTIYFLPGNRDFLIGKKFLRQTGCKLLADESKIFLYGTPTLLMHGDTLCTADVAYLKSRKILRHPLIKKVFLLLPLALRQFFARKVRAASMRHISNTAPKIMDVSPDAVLATMQKYEVQLLIHGHTHRPAVHPLLLGSLALKRIVLGAWHERASVLSCDESGEQRLIF